MCVILVCKNTKPTMEILRQCAIANPHGIGIAWKESSLENIQYKKGASLKEVYSISQKQQLPQVIHFRLASVGKVSKLLCHPFSISNTVTLEVKGSSKALLFHNGHWGEWHSWCTKIREKSPRFFNQLVSDSRVIAYLLYLKGRKVLEEIAGKFVIFSNKGIAIYGGGWQEENGICFSNLYWKRDFSVYKNYFESTDRVQLDTFKYMQR